MCIKIHNLLILRGFSQLWVKHIHHLHPEGALWTEPEPQCLAFRHLLWRDIERRKHLPELQDQPESCSAALRQLLLQGIFGSAH